MKKNLLIAVGFLSLIAASALALSVSDAYTNLFRIPQSEGSGQPDINAQWSGSRIARLEATTTAVSIFAGEGLVDSVCVQSGVADGYAVLGDSAVGADFSVTANAQAIARRSTNPVLASNTAAGAGCSFFAPPLRFSNGLAIDNSATDIRTIVGYRITRQ